MALLSSFLEPRTDKILNVHSHLSTTLTSSDSDFPSFRILIMSRLMILPKNAMLLKKLQLDLIKILDYGNIMNKRLIFIVTFLTLFDLLSLTNQTESHLQILKNEKLHILIPHLLQLSITEVMVKNVIPTLPYKALN